MGLFQHALRRTLNAGVNAVLICCQRLMCSCVDFLIDTCFTVIVYGILNLSAIALNILIVVVLVAVVLLTVFYV